MKNKNLIKSFILIIIIIFVIGFYFIKNKPQNKNSNDSILGNLSEKTLADKETHEGYLVKHNDIFVFSDCFSDRIYIWPKPKDINYENIASAVSISIININNDLTLDKIEILNKTCKPEDDIPFVQNMLTGYGVINRSEAYIQDGHSLVLDNIDRDSDKVIATFQFLHYGDIFSIYQAILTLEKNVVVDEKYEIKRMDPNEIFKTEGKVAIVFSPNDKEIEKMKEKDEEGFYIVADDNIYYQSNAREFLEKNGIETVSTDKRYINLIREDSESEGEEIVLDTKAIEKSGWGILLFDGKNCPMSVDIVDIQTDYEKYFNQL